MTQDEAREAIMHEWDQRPVERRLSEQDAEAFARDAEARFQFEATGHKHQIIMGWLLNSFGTP